MKRLFLVLVLSFLCSLIGVGSTAIYSQTVPSLNLQSKQTTFGHNQTILIDVIADDLASQPINAAEINLTYPTDLLRYSTSRCDDCDMRIETPVSHNAETGAISITRATIQPIKRDSARIVSLVFSSLEQDGSAEVKLAASSKLIHAYDYSNVLGAIQDVRLNIDETVASSATINNPNDGNVLGQLSQSDTSPAPPANPIIDMSVAQLSLIGLAVAVAASAVWWLVYSSKRKSLKQRSAT